MERRPDYSASQLIEYAGISRATYREWTAKKVFAADVFQTLGTGHHRQFAFWNLVEARIGRELRTLGMKIPAVRDLMLQVKVLDKVTNPQAQEFLEQWRNFRNPEKRPDDAAAFLVITTAPTHAEAWSLGEGLWWSLLLSDGGTDTDVRLSSLKWPTTVLVNVRSILEELEEATGDRWRPEPGPGDPELDRRHREDLGLAPIEYEGRWWERGLHPVLQRQADAEAEIDIDRRLRAELGLPKRSSADYAGWMLTGDGPALITEESAERYRQREADAGGDDE